MIHRLFALTLALSAASPLAAAEALQADAKPAEPPKAEAAKVEPPKAAELAKPAETTTIKKLATGLRAWFENFKEGLTESSVSAQRQRTSATVVAAVRGPKQGSEELDRPAWKTGAQAAKSRAQREQREALHAAVARILDGDVETGKGMLEEFVKTFPDSAYVGDAKQALGKLGEGQVAAGGQ